jgi:hypothetical protein
MFKCFKKITAYFYDISHDVKDIAVILL